MPHSHVVTFTCHTFSRCHVHMSHVHTCTPSHVRTFARSHVHLFTRSLVQSFPRCHDPTISRSHVLGFTPSHDHTLTRSHVHTCDMLTFTRSHVDSRSVGSGGERTPYAPGGRSRMEAGAAKADTSTETGAPTPRNLKGEGLGGEGRG